MILRALLDNRGKRGDGATKPVLLVSPASHTLDRALAGVVGFEPNVVRVASTRAEGLKAHNLSAKVREVKGDDAHAAAVAKVSKTSTRGVPLAHPTTLTAAARVDRGALVSAPAAGADCRRRGGDVRHRPDHVPLRGECALPPPLHLHHHHRHRHHRPPRRHRLHLLHLLHHLRRPTDGSTSKPHWTSGCSRCATRPRNGRSRSSRPTAPGSASSGRAGRRRRRRRARRRGRVRRSGSGNGARGGEPEGRLGGGDARGVRGGGGGGGRALGARGDHGAGRDSNSAPHTRSPTPLTPLLPLQVRAEAALAIEEERKIDDGAADEEEGNQVSLARDDEIERPLRGRGDRGSSPP